MIESTNTAMICLYEVQGAPPMYGRCRFRPADVKIHGSCIGDRRIDAEVTGPAIRRDGTPDRLHRTGGLLFDGPVETWPDWLRNLAVFGQVTVPIGETYP